MKLEPLDGGIRLATDPLHPVLTDSLLLAGFCAFKKGDRLIDIGAGNGVLAFSLMGRGFDGPATLLEMEGEALALARRTAEENGLEDRVSFLEQDLRHYKPPRQFSLALANPPYFAAGPPSPLPARAAARHGGGATLAEVCAAAARCLQPGGRLNLCIPPARLATLMALLVGEGLAPKKMRLVRPAPQKPPFLALVCAVQGGGEGLEILDELIYPPQ